MGKKKKKRSDADASNPGAAELGIPHSPACPVSHDSLDPLGRPFASALLVEGGPSESNRVFLPPETMHENKLSTGSIVLMAVSDAPTKDPTKTPTSAFAPGPNFTGFGMGKPISVSQLLGHEDHTLANGPQREHYMLLGEVWPGTKLQKGTLQLSGALLQNFSFPSVGSSILLYAWDMDTVPTSKNLELNVVMGGRNGESEEKPLVACGCKSKESSSSGEGPNFLRDRQVEWLKQALSSAGGRQIDLLKEFAVRQLNGRMLLPGGLVPLSVLGCSVVFRITKNSEDLCIKVEWGITKIQLKLQSAELERGGSGGTPATGSSVGNSNEHYLNRVREAAVQKSQGSSQESAKEAATRAAASGLASLGKIGAEILGGLSDYDKAIESLVVMPLQTPDTFEKYGLKPPKGVVFYGPPGTGKTILACEAARRAGAKMFVVNGPDVMSEFYGGSEAGLSGVFHAAEELSPSVIFLDEVDALMPARGGRSGGLASTPGASTSNRLVTTLLTLMDGLQDKEASNKRVVVIAATNRLDSIDPALRRPGRFDREIEVGVPSPQARCHIMQARFQKINHELSEECINDVAMNAHGFVSADLAALCRESAMIALRRVINSGNLDTKGGAVAVVSKEDFQKAQTLIRPSAIREIAVQVPKVHWDDVGGLDDVKQKLKEAVEWPIKYAASLTRIGAEPPKGVLLYGPPGCSKTLLAKATATETGMNFLSVKGSELLSQYVGESEKALSLLFARGAQLSPCVIFFDEIDGLVGNRGGSGDGETGLGDRMITQFLVELDGVKDRGQVVVIAATNKPEALDGALLRPGRFDRLVYVQPPDQSGREAILNVCLRSMPMEPNMDLVDLAGRMEGYTGADIAAVCQGAGLGVLEEDMNGEKVCLRHMLKAMDLVTPSAPTGFLELAKYENFQRGV